MNPCYPVACCLAVWAIAAICGILVMIGGMHTALPAPPAEKFRWDGMDKDK
jgi:hypothetical protein